MAKSMNTFMSLGFECIFIVRKSEDVVALKLKATQREYVFKEIATQNRAQKQNNEFIFRGIAKQFC